MSPMDDTDPLAFDVVACLRCGATRIATRTRTSIAPTGCPDCGYVGWRPARPADRPTGAERRLRLALHGLAAHPSS